MIEYGYESEAMTGADDAVPVSVDVSGVEELRLVADKNGETNSDHADWGGARVVRHADPAEPDPGPVPGDAAWTTPFGYRGEYTDAETGYVYLRARYYDPEMGRFISEDPVRDGMNWYVYCANNPVMWVDPLGLEPTKEEAAEMANQIYDAEVGATVSGGWTLNEIKTGGTGMKMGIYSRQKSNGEIEYALVNKGTTAAYIYDWVNNVTQPFGASVDMYASLQATSEFMETHFDYEITFVGHSKGGAEAMANALMTNRNCIVFNPAPLNPTAYGIASEVWNRHIRAYVVENEILNNIFGVPSAVNDLEYLPQQTTDTPWWQEGVIASTSIDEQIANHMMSAVLNAFEED